MDGNRDKHPDQPQPADQLRDLLAGKVTATTNSLPSFLGQIPYHTTPRGPGNTHKQPYSFSGMFETGDGGVIEESEWNKVIGIR